MDTNKLYAILRETTIQLRKGDKIEEREHGGLRVTEVFMMPHESEAPADIEKVDLHFVMIGIKKREAEARRDDLIEILSQYSKPDRLAAGPSYIEVGAEVGDQGAALQLFALGKVLGLWAVITPETLGIRGAAAEELAGGGLVMISGYKP